MVGLSVSRLSGGGGGRSYPYAVSYLYLAARRRPAARAAMPHAPHGPAAQSQGRVESRGTVLTGLLLLTFVPLLPFKM